MFSTCLSTPTTVPYSLRKLHITMVVLEVWGLGFGVSQGVQCTLMTESLNTPSMYTRQLRSIGLPESRPQPVNPTVSAASLSVLQYCDAIKKKYCFFFYWSLSLSLSLPLSLFLFHPPLSVSLSRSLSPLSHWAGDLRCLLGGNPTLREALAGSPGHWLRPHFSLGVHPAARSRLVA